VVRVDILSKIASRFRAIGFSSISAVIWLLVRRAPPVPFHFSGWLLLDLMIVVGALYGAAIIGTDALARPLNEIWLLGVGVQLIATSLIFILQGLYRSVIRYMGQQAVWDLVKAVSYSTLALTAVSTVISLSLPGTALLVYWLLLFVGIGGVRLTSRAWHQISTRADARRVIIYGAGESGRQLLNALNHGSDYRVVAFIDDNPELHET